jgi:hypothetical protein
VLGFALARRVARVVVEVASASPSDHAAHTCEEANGGGSCVLSRQHRDEHKADGDDEHPKDDCPRAPRTRPRASTLRATASEAGRDQSAWIRFVFSGLWAALFTQGQRSFRGIRRTGSSEVVFVTLASLPAISST